MIKIFGLLLLVFLFYFQFKSDNRSEEMKMVHKIVSNVSDELYFRHRLKYIGIAESSSEGCYNNVGILLKLRRSISKEEGRKMLVDCAEELLTQLNSDPGLATHLKPYPFTLRNIRIEIYPHNTDGKLTYHPDLGIISVENGMVSYITDIPEGKEKQGWFTEEKESYEQALSIVRSTTAL